MPLSLPSHLKVPTRLEQLLAIFARSLNFYRLHVIVFTVVPLVFSGIMYASNTKYRIAYIDCLFMCTSAMTVTGLATINLSTLSPWQQVILFLQMLIGSVVFVSIIMVVVRRHFFRQRFKHVIKERQQRQNTFSLSRTFSRVTPAVQPLNTLRQRLTRTQHVEKDGDTDIEPSTPTSTKMKALPRASGEQKPSVVNVTPTKRKKKKGIPQKFTKDMIKRIEGGGVGMVNPMGWYNASRANTPEGGSPAMHPELAGENAEHTQDAPRSPESHISPLPSPRLTESPTALNPAEEAIAEGEAVDQVDKEKLRRHVPYSNKPASEDAFPRSRTIAFDAPDDGLDHDRHDNVARDGYLPRSATMRSNGGMDSRMLRTATIDVNGMPNNFPRTYSMRPVRRIDTRLSGFGGFPTPLELAKTGFHKVFPRASDTLAKTLTIPLTRTVTGRGSISGEGGAKEVPYISFSAVVGRNSRFQGLTEEQMEELGGVEYRALKALVWIVSCYFIAVQLIGFIIIAPYIGAGGRYDYVFQDQYRLVSIPWFALFQSVSAFSNSGMSLVDESMIPFQKAYVMIVVLIFVILAGNTLRFFIWVLHKIVPSQSRFCETLKFLLDHPRRCFIYMFPSTQTWVLLLVMLSLTTIDWVSFLVLDIGTPAIESIPVGTRIAAGFLQSAAVRAAGFGIVPLASLAPAVKVLYVIMMYISVYPLAMSVRSTNVYEERSLGLFEDADDEEWTPEDKGPQAVAQYLGWHARRQLAFDIWWLGFALWLVCIIERGAIDAEENESWFNIFSIIFELVSAYGTVGLSLGVSYDNYSLSGDFRKLSKLVVCAVMLRGRHRGLPVAIDRAVMLPRDFTAAEEDAFEQHVRRTRRTSSYDPELSTMSRDAAGAPTSPLASGRRPSQPSFKHAPDSPTALHFSLPPPRSPRSSSERTDRDRPHTQERRASVLQPAGGLETVEEGKVQRSV
ncbi:hypothetical protein Q5752_002186 [Cryptotrichosporon argae]